MQKEMCIRDRVYSKLRSVEESAETSVNNIAVAAYQDGYQGIGEMCIRDRRRQIDAAKNQLKVLTRQKIAEDVYKRQSMYRSPQSVF